MKKIKTSIMAMTAAAMLLMGGSAFAADFDVNTGVIGGAISADAQALPFLSGGALGLGGAVGTADADGSGFIAFGDVEGNVGVVGGGLSSTTSYTYTPGIGDVSIGVGSATNTEAVTGAHLDVAVGGAFGAAAADADGFAAQGSVNASSVDDSPIYFNSAGSSDGVAAQASFGGFESEVAAGTLVGNADASADVDITMAGKTHSQSYRAVDFGTVRTETMGTNVSTTTEIMTNTDTDTNSAGFAGSYADVDGGARAFGGNQAETSQLTGTGAALAQTEGAYSGGTAVGGNYLGTSYGYTQTSATTVNGMNGSIMNASAGQTVHSAQY